MDNVHFPFQVALSAEDRAGGLHWILRLKFPVFFLFARVGVEIFLFGKEFFILFGKLFYDQ
ncbi:MAG: hypothetical protein ACLVLC_09525 [Finegoldia magna]